VGDPNQIHYVYDLKSGSVTCVWHGDFVDATPMWHDRGDGSFRPRGAVQYLFTGQALAFLSNEKEAFPQVSDSKEFKSSGYEIEAVSGRPVFNYTYRDLHVSDRVYPDDDNRIITHEVSIKNETGKGLMPFLFYKLAEGSSIILTSNGTYAIDDKQYYIKVMPAFKPRIRESNGVKELIIPIEGTSIQYSIIW
jgi:hypothetical protein